MKKLLVVDDNLDYLGFLVSVLKEHFETVCLLSKL